MKPCTKPMLDNHRGQQKGKIKRHDIEKRREKIKRHDKEEKIPKIKICLVEGERRVISNFSNSNNLNGAEKGGKGKLGSVENNHTITSNSSASNSIKPNEVAESTEDLSFLSIVDRVKLRGRRRTSDAAITQTEVKLTSQSGLPGKKRKRENNSFASSVSSSPTTLSSVSSSPTTSSVSSSPTTSSVSSSPTTSSVSSSPTTSLRLVETHEPMDQWKENSYQSFIPSSTSESRTTDIVPVHLDDLMECPCINPELFFAIDDKSVAINSVSSDYLPSKKPKLMEHNLFISDKGPSAPSSPFNINELEVASYEEVSSVEPLQTSSEPYPAESFGVNDVFTVVDVVNFSQIINSTSLPKNLEKPASNTEKIDCTHSEVCKKEKKKETDDVTVLDHDYLPTLKSELKGIGAFNKDLKILGSSEVEEFFSDLKRTKEHMDNFVDLVLKLEKEPSLVKKKSLGAIHSAFKHSTEARQYLDKIVADFQNKKKSRDDVVKKLDKLSSSSTDGALTFKNKNGAFRQETFVRKENEKKRVMGGRCIVYVGNIPHNYSELQLKERFRKFGTIKDIQIKSKVCELNSSNGFPVVPEERRNFGFITFSSNQEATDAIEGGNKDQKVKFHLSFGARRQFVGEEYRDLDGIVAKNENSSYNCNSGRSPFLSAKKQDEDFDIILKNYSKDRGFKPQPFRLKCKA